MTGQDLLDRKSDSASILKTKLFPAIYNFQSKFLRLIFP